MKRVTLADGSTILLPMDAVLLPPIATEEELKAAMKTRLISGTW